MITFYQGNSVDINLSVFHGNTDGVFDITNSKIWFTIKRSFDDPDSSALLQVTGETGIVFINPAFGLALISLLPTATQNLPTEISLHCDVQIRTPAGKVFTVYVDTVIVNPKVTNSLNYT